jgi:hypothetical protein
MYLVLMDQLAREDIAAAAAAHRELGRDYDGAVAEGLVERIGAEIDRRVDARLGQPVQRSRGGLPSPAVSPSRAAITFGLGSMTIGGITSVAILNNNAGAGNFVVLIWVIIAIINVVYARRR